MREMFDPGGGGRDRAQREQYSQRLVGKVQRENTRIEDGGLQQVPHQEIFGLKKGIQGCI